MPHDTYDDAHMIEPDPIMARVRAAYGTLMQAETETGPDHSETYNDRLITKALAYLDEAISAPLPPAPVEYRWGIQTHSAPPRAINPQWICSPCLANRTIGQPSVTVVSVIHADPAKPYPTCADCETREAARQRPTERPTHPADYTPTELESDYERGPT